MDAARLRLVVTHRTAYHFPEGANRLLIALRLWPEPHAGQLIRKWEVNVNGTPVIPNVRNGLGEQVGLWSAPATPGEIAVVASGVVETEDRAGVVSGLTVRPNPMIFLRSTDRTRADATIRKLVAAPEADTPLLSWLHDLMAIVRDRIRYLTGSTHAETTATEALQAGAGVCQDHAHVFIAAARAHGVPARYVCGYMLADGEHGDLHETHAWAEAWVDGLGWVAFDPSNGLCPTERYIRLTTGLDSFDAAPIRALASGGQGTGVFADVRITTSNAWGSSEADDEARIRALQQQQSQQ